MALVPCLYFRLSGFLDKERSFVGGMVGNIEFFFLSLRSSDEVMATAAMV